MQIFSGCSEEKLCSKKSLFIKVKYKVLIIKLIINIANISDFSCVINVMVIKVIKKKKKKPH